MSLPVSLPTTQPDPGDIVTTDGTPLRDVLLRAPNGHLLVHLITPPRYGPAKVPDWAEQFNAQSGSCKLVTAVLPEEPPAGFPFVPDDSQLFEGGRLVRVLHDTCRHTLNAAAEFVFDLGKSDVKLHHFDRPVRPDAADGS